MLLIPWQKVEIAVLEGDKGINVYLIVFTLSIAISGGGCVDLFVKFKKYLKFKIKSKIS